MNIELLGKKLGMSQVYDDENNLVPVTIIEAGPCPVLQVKTLEKDGYSAIQIGFNPKGKSPNKSNRCSRGHAKKAGVEPQQIAQEIRCNNEHEYEQGNVITVENFKDIKLVDVISKTKGKGFQGVVKRWNFAGGPASHGSMFHRRGGSYGLCQWPGRVFKNKKMPGHMGDVSRTTQNLKVVKILPEKNLVLVKGSVPGHKGSLITLRVAKKS
ncbi:MAG TPA: 50S ribosomal protein L3 [Opitutae bacterium]|nr:50S ribosomal protein L3 [Opitutae bacterium]HBJ61879.1 50S ribosomal protein L3 [Opitutae bacterium]|tara:strand:+ start:1050 stop:1685 length:636 start_codon:yes stop_codon:yes gene_type:complete